MQVDSTKFHNKSKYVLLAFLFLIGAVLSLSGSYLLLKEPNNLFYTTLQGFGFTIVTAGIVSLISDSFLLKSLSNKTEDVFEKIIDEKIPLNIKNLKKSGIVDTYQTLNTEKLLGKLSRAKNCEIYIFKIWISDIVRMNPILRDAVENRGCNVKILLLDPKEINTIEKRASTLIIETPQWIQTQIFQNIEIIENLKNSIDIKHRHKFEFRTHNSFVSTSLFGIGSEVSLGLYLRDCLSSNSFQIKLCGETKSYFHTITEHFDKEWDEGKQYEFGSQNQVFDLNEEDQLNILEEKTEQLKDYR